MLARFEKVRPATGSFTAYERCEPEFAFNWHYHPEFELTLITDSQGQRAVGDGICDYRPGDLVLLGPNLPHSYRSWPADSPRSKQHRAVVIQFRKECFGDHFFELPEMGPVSQMLQRSAIGLAFGDTETGRSVANRIRKLPSLKPAERLILLLSSLVELATESRAAAISTQSLLPLCRIDDQRRIDCICTYLHRHFDREVDFHATGSNGPHEPGGSLPIFSARHRTNHDNLRQSASSRSGHATSLEQRLKCARNRISCRIWKLFKLQSTVQTHQRCDTAVVTSRISKWVRTALTS